MLKLEIEWVDGRYNYATKEKVDCDAKTADEALSYLLTYAKQQSREQNQYLTATCIVSDDEKIIYKRRI